MNPHIPTVLQPLDQHLETILCELLPRLIRLSIIVAKPRCRVILLDPEPVSVGVVILTLE